MNVSESLTTIQVVWTLFCAYATCHTYDPKGYCIMKKEVKRGELYFADLDPVIGSEQGGFRPALIIQNNTGNRYSNTVIAACVTSKLKSKLPTHVPLVGMAGLPENSVILLEQIRTIDKSRLNAFVGSLNEKLMAQVDTALAISMGIPKQAANVMTLCTHCYRQFNDSDAYLMRRVDYDQKYREPCTLCSVRSGYDFEVIKK